MQSEKPFLKIAITREDFFPGEAERIYDLLDSGEVDLVHIRKPGASDEETAALIEQIPERFHGSLKLHQNYGLLNNFNLAGIHLKGDKGENVESCKKKCRVVPQVRPPSPGQRFSHIYGSQARISKSMHTLAELDNAGEYDYVTLSPVYDSISKAGYKAAFEFSELREKLKEVDNVIALGGVTPEKIQELASLGFRGAALLGHYWR